MAAGWVKSLQCKSKSVDDVFHPTPKQLLPTASCRNTFQTLKDVIDNPKPMSKPIKHERVSNPNRVRRTVSAPLPIRPDTFFPSLTELPVGHPSRNVVEIIFQTRWGPKAFSGRIEMVLKFQNMTRTLTRFEEYRESVKIRAGSGSARCVADGNEMMRFHCLGPTSGSINGDGGICGIDGVKGYTSIGTYSGSGTAHDSAGGGRGRRAMLVCRVIAGRA